MKIACKRCGDELDVGPEERAIVALCIPEDAKASIWSCDSKQWGSPATRFDCASADDRVRHVVQTNP